MSVMPHQNSPWTSFAAEPPAQAETGPVEQLLHEALLALRPAAGPATAPAAPADADPLVSVIITAFKCGDHLRASVESLLRQSIANVEILIVDDCSPDDTFVVAAQFAARDRRVRALRTASNSGTYVAKNLGLLHARGRYVTFQDSDDISHPRRLELQLQPLLADAALAATTCHYCRIDEDSGQLLLNRGAKSRAGLISLLFERQRVLDTAGFFDCVRVNADDEFKTRVKRGFGNKAIRELEDCLYFALLRAEGLTVAGHTANNLAGTNLKTFLAPVRQRYTRNFQAWHQSAPAGQPLYMDFPGVERRFPAPVSIDPMATQRPSRCTLFLPRIDQASTLATLLQADPKVLHLLSAVAFAAAPFAGADDPEAALRAFVQGVDLVPVPHVPVPLESTLDRQFKEAADLIGTGVVLLALDTAAFVGLSANDLRQALYKLYQAPSPATVVICQGGRLMVLNIDKIAVASLRIPREETSLLRGVLRQLVAAGAQSEFVV